MRRVRLRHSPVFVLVLALAALAYNVLWPGDPPATAAPSTTSAAKTGTTPGTAVSEDRSATGTLVVSFLDVGQGDAILVQQGDATLLVDAGEADRGADVLAELERRGIRELDLVIGTHPHADHIGGMAEVLTSVNADRVLLPDVTHTTMTYEQLLRTLKDGNFRVSRALPRQSWTLGQATLEILGPVAPDEEDLNNASVVCRVVFGETAFVLTADAEREAERAILDSGAELSARVLQAGHHGSVTSTTLAFLDAVAPEVVVISVGADNPYGHPHEEILKALGDRGIRVYRTDRDGTVTAVSDGTDLTWETEREDAVK